LRGPFHQWQPTNTIEWFESRGVKLKTEEDGRMFPTTDSSETIIDCLTSAADKAGIKVHKSTGVKWVKKTDSGFEITTQANTVLHCRKLLIATGGMRTGPLMTAIQDMGHTITALAPSLFTFHIKDTRIKELPGLATNIIATIPEAKLTTEGPALITHWGLSGPAILRLSSLGARWIQERDYRFSIMINWTGQHSLNDLMDDFKKRKVSEGKQQLSKQPLFKIPRRLWASLLNAANIPESLAWAHASNQHIKDLVNQLAEGRFNVTGKTMNKEEFVTCGGVSLKEINFKNSESKAVPGLHFAGEVLDIDGITGGFNFQAAWTTGRAAGIAMADGL
ncbi:aminoacetone oxidase family FAD-binding enzyme, partial [Verrucomicrobia bacterium]|nr:aminoacetone oxidase family FAD-binding enzyme [Verrucomicrobiota bacterium]